MRQPASRRLAATMALVLSACSYTPTTSLRYDPIPAREPGTAAHSLAVLPLEEGRPPRAYPGLQGHLFKTYIPLLPYVRVHYERLDESRIRHMENRGAAPGESEHFTVAIAQEVARDLDASEIFRDVQYVPDRSAAGAYDLVLGGTLKSTSFDVYATSYMLGMAGVLLWLLPIPMGKNEATVAAEFELFDRPGRSIWTHAMSERASKTYTAYNSSGESTSSQYRIEIKRYGSNEKGIDGDSFWAYHAEALRAGMGTLKASLASSLVAPAPGP